MTLSKKLTLSLASTGSSWSFSSLLEPDSSNTCKALLVHNRVQVRLQALHKVLKPLNKLKG